MPKETRFPQFGNYGDTEAGPWWLSVGLIALGVGLAVGIVVLAGVFR